MIVREDEARNMWCPMARVPAGDVVVNRAITFKRDEAGNVIQYNIEVGGPSGCLGKACMWWHRVSETQGRCGVTPI